MSIAGIVVWGELRSPRGFGVQSRPTGEPRSCHLFPQHDTRTLHEGDNKTGPSDILLIKSFHSRGAAAGGYRRPGCSRQWGTPFLQPFPGSPTFPTEG